MLGKLDIELEARELFDFVMKRSWLDLREKLPGFRLKDRYSIVRSSKCPHRV